MIREPQRYVQEVWKYYSTLIPSDHVGAIVSMVLFLAVGHETFVAGEQTVALCTHVR